MMTTRVLHRAAPLMITAAALLSTVWITADRTAAHADEPKLVVFTTIPDWAALAEEVGGDRVTASSMVFGREDAHFSEPRPSFIKKLAGADMFITTGLGLERGYEESMLTAARNPRVQSGRPGYVVAATAITPMQQQRNVPITRAMGDLHAQGNAHFNVDPISGLAVAALIRDRLSQIRPAAAGYFAGRYDRFKARVGEKLVGKTLAEKYDATKLAALAGHGKLDSFLEAQGDRAQLQGWLGMMSPYRNAKVIDDHPMWPYFAERFGIVIVGNLEKTPGIQPSTSHMKAVVETMNAQGVQVIIKAAYYDPRFARFVADKTGATIAELAHQVGAVPGTDDYLSMIDYNVRTLADAFARSD